MPEATITAERVADGLGVDLDKLKAYAQRSHIVDPNDAWTLEDVRKARSHFLGSAGKTVFDGLLAPEPEPEEPEEAVEESEESATTE